MLKYSSGSRAHMLVAFQHDHVTERLVAKFSPMGSHKQPPMAKRSTGAEVDVMQSSFSISGASRNEA